MRHIAAPLTTLACLALTCATAVAGFGAQAPPRAVVLHPVQTHDILFLLEGGGDNALALMHDDGVVLIDPLPAGWGKASLEAIAAVSEQQVTTIINIRDSEAHLKANAEYPTATRIIAHRHVAARAAKMAAFAGAGARFLPNEVVGDRFSLLDGLDRIELHHLGPGRTDGDLVVVFPMKGVAYLGDLFPSRRVPVVERDKGGSATAFPATLAKARALPGLTIAVPGHEPPAVREHGAQKPGTAMPLSMFPPWGRLGEYADFTRELVGDIMAAKQAGTASPQDAVAGLALPDRFKAYDMRGATALAEAVFKEFQ